VHPDLAGIALPSIEQAAKSDAAFVRDLGARYDAVATVKDKTLIFLPVGAQVNAGGAVFGSVTIQRDQCGPWRFTVADREAHDGAEAKWHDRGAAKKKVASAGGASNPKRIKRTFASEAEAQAAADAEARRAERGEFTFECDLALGDPGIEPNNRVTLQGWDSETDGVSWIVDEATHILDGRAGLTSRLKLVSVKA
jgi:phage protein D